MLISHGYLFPVEQLEFSEIALLRLPTTSLPLRNESENFRRTQQAVPDLGKGQVICERTYVLLQVSYFSRKEHARDKT